MNLFVPPGVEFKYFPTHVTNWKGCIRTFETKEKYTVKMTMKATSTRYDIADFYNGNDTSAASGISHFDAVGNGKMTTTVMSWGRQLTVVLLQSERFVQYASVTSVPQKVNDCSFEDGWCGWHNYEDDLVAERKLWEVYTCSSKRHGRFNGQERDHTYERGTGNYDTL
ncbi:hypothetical protein NP493_181g06049 [Ridgeia piscesae]|uniref:MAM domain-containing protein n=1 Tax=Ridgeia piscesae TaxID=27915 RepID=A0AAD9P2L8_RIDPI|nr:hypothetical protein NP493_181g06049 [Ridgeia piscesae]